MLIVLFKYKPEDVLERWSLCHHLYHSNTTGLLMLLKFCYHHSEGLKLYRKKSMISDLSTKCKKLCVKVVLNDLWLDFSIHVIITYFFIIFFVLTVLPRIRITTEGSTLKCEHHRPKIYMDKKVDVEFCESSLIKNFVSN